MVCSSPWPSYLKESEKNDPVSLMKSVYRGLLRLLGYDPVRTCGRDCTQFNMCAFHYATVICGFFGLLMFFVFLGGGGEGGGLCCISICISVVYFMKLTYSVSDCRYYVLKYRQNVCNSLYVKGIIYKTHNFVYLKHLHFTHLTRERTRTYIKLQYQQRIHDL